MESRRHYDNVYKAGIWTEEQLDPRKLSKSGLILKKLSPQRGEILLDLGCGNGRYSKIFSLRGVSVAGLDISKLALDLAKKQHVHCNLVLGTAEKLPFKDGVFDKVFAMDVLEHVQNDFECLNGIIRIIKNGGVIFVSFPKEKKVFKFSEDSRLGHLHVYQKDSIKEFLEKNGLVAEIYFMDAFFDYFCYHLDLAFKRILTHEKVDPLKSSIKRGDLSLRLGRKLLTLVASIDLFFCRFPFGNTFFVFARKRNVSQKVFG
ncbi:MAG: class I SAM-dependent methyltransferase [Candidatus Bathyarchaeota archaeon]|nr:class I SAM-dependent methyltransferase [Candidatus Bathyarchaeota archaeon]